MRIAYFTHSLISCWNHGNAHFQRGVLRALRRLGHDAIAYEAEENWSHTNLLRERPDADQRFRSTFPDLVLRRYHSLDAIEAQLESTDLVIVHEWNDPALIAAIGRLRRQSRFTLLFHDTHHRAVSEPDAIRRADLSNYDGVLAFGETLARIYESWGWSGRAFVWHEAADTTLFSPPATPTDRHGAVWIGNWGDGERTAELETFLLRPCATSGATLDVHGVRYPDSALALLRQFGATYHGWVANDAVPALFAQHLFTVHVPRRFYAEALPGIPTIRIFEALACGIPLLCAPWEDRESLFRPGEDYLVAHSEAQMAAHMKALRNDPALREELAASGLARIRAAHSCDHRAGELLGIAARLNQTAELA